jgi:ketosteroid isomerase-like protein
MTTDPTARETAEEQAAKEVVEAWYDAIRQLDFTAMAAIWDTDFDRLVYQPEEYDAPFLSFDAIKGYWTNVPNLVDRVLEWTPIVSELAVIGDVAVAYSRLQTSIKLQGIDQPFDGELRCSLALRRSAGTWKLIHYHESRLVSVESVVASLTS